LQDRQYLVRAAAYDGLVRAFAIDSTAVVEELRCRHGTDPAVTAAIGRVATGALLFGAMLKESDHLVTIRVQGDGPAGTILASANGAGGVRGLVENPRPDVEQAAGGKLNVAGVVGRNGFLTVTRDLGLRQPYSSTVELVSGEIGDDLAYYLARSEQIPSAVGIGVFVQADGAVEAAGGYIVQVMPGLDDADTVSLEEAIRGLPHPTAMLRAGETPEEILGRVFPAGYEVLERKPVRFDCPCSKERAERALVLLGAPTLEEMRGEQGDREYSELVCQFCKEKYRFTLAELDALIETARAAG
jgi:molecular chaperone Hsp33